MALIQPWAIDGAKLNGAQARSQLFKATSGARGVTLPGDLKVKALPTPGAFVRIGPGGATLPNDYLTNGGGQSYGTLMVASEDLPVPATGSGGGATRYVIQRIIDPEYSGQTPADPLTYRYDPFVLVSSVNALPYPYVVLAKINQPANTATITNAMITDLREVANPRREEVLRYSATLSAGTETLVATRGLGEWFPNAGGQQSVDIPEWATRVLIEARWLSARYDLSKAGFGRQWVEWGPGAGGSGGTQDRLYRTQEFAWDQPNSTSGIMRTDLSTVADMAVPAAMRGTTQQFIFKAKITGGAAGSLTIDGLSGVSLKLTFLQVADPSTS